MAQMELGNPNTVYVNQYDSQLLFPIDRAPQRKIQGVPATLPFTGDDIWTAYEFTCLLTPGKPIALVLEIRVPATAPAIVESKSMKLYLGSFAGSSYPNLDSALSQIEADLSAACGAAVRVKRLAEIPQTLLSGSDDEAQCLDELDVTVPDGGFSAAHLVLKSEASVSVSYYTDLFRSLCPMTGQPDYARIRLRWEGGDVDEQGLLRYLLSFREHGEFAEQVAERIFIDLTKVAKPSRLGVRAEFTRRGGIDINPQRQMGYDNWEYVRHYRQ